MTAMQRNLEETIREKEMATVTMRGDLERTIWEMEAGNSRLQSELQTMQVKPGIIIIMFGARGGYSTEGGPIPSMRRVS